MPGLEDIPKKQIFDTPDGYFDKLPARIQSRIAEDRKGVPEKSAFSYALPYALALVAIIAGIWYYNFTAQSEVQTILASVQTEDLVDYLHDSEISTDEVLEIVDFSTEELEAIESEAYDLGLENIETLDANKANED